VGKPVLPILREAALQAIENKTTQTLDLEHDRRLYSLFFTPVIAAGYANLYAGDITERKRAEETLQASEMRYRRLFEAAKDGILILDPETGQIVDVNPFLIDLLGYSYNEYLGKKLWEMGPFKNVVASQDAFGELRKAGYIRYEELPLETKSGKHIAVEFVSNVYEADHKTVIQCNIRDITERKWAEEALKASEQRYRSVVENTGVGIIVIQDGKQVFYNPQIYKLLEYTEEDFLSIDFVALIHPDDRQLMLNRIGQRLAGEPVDTGPVEVRTITKSGKVRWCEASSVAIDWEGKPAIQAFIHDITERRQAEEALAHERDLLHTLMDNAPDLIYFKDTSSRFTRINQAEAEVLGVPSPEEAVGKTDADFFTPEHAQAALADEQKIVQTGTPLIGKVEHIRHANGEWRWVLTTKVPIVANEQVTGMVGVTTDITAIKQTEEALQRYADRLRLLREVDIAILSAHLPELIAQNTLQQLNKLVPCQRSSVTLFDFEAETFTTLAVKTEGETYLKPGLRHPLIHFAGDFDKLRQNRVSIEEDLRDLTRPSPVIRTLIVEGVRTYVGVPLIVKADLIGSLNLAAASPDFFTAEHLEIAQEVAGQLAVAVQQARLYEELQKHSQMLEQAVEKATAELREANEALKTLDQLKDSFLSTAAHELRTPLTSIQGFSEILLTRELDEDRKKYYLDTINKQSAQLAQIIDDLLDISRLEAGKGLEIKSEPVDLGLLLVETVQPFIETSVKHHFRLEGLTETPPVQGDPFRLEQVIRNLLSNAVKYSPEGGSITIHTRVSGKYFEVGVQDEGIGLTPEQQAHLFEKFYRADESNRSTGGTGLGLAICKLIVEGHGGHIWAESESGAGSTFAFSIPLAT